MSEFLATVVGDAEQAALEPPGERRVAAALRLATTWGHRLPVPGEGSTPELWQVLADVAAIDLTLARVLEPHLDALAILAQAGQEPAPGSYGVWAAEGPGARLEVATVGGRRQLTGRKPWCSLADDVDHGLVTAWTSEHGRTLFAVDTAHPGVRPDHLAVWAPHGLSAVRSGAVDFTAVPASAVGGEGWYLQRPGFAWGGIGVAACWLGGAVGLLRRLHAAARERSPDQVALLHLGAADTAVHAAAAALALAARAVDAGKADGLAGTVLALRTRAVVRRAAEEVLERVAHALGPGPLASEPQHAARVADLHLYLRQEHAERDAATLGRHVADGPVPRPSLP